MVVSSASPAAVWAGFWLTQQQQHAQLTFMPMKHQQHMWPFVPLSVCKPSKPGNTLV